ncbi:MAG: type II secretion system F family protein [Candidatus Acidiferrales bacterium]
MAVLLAGLVFFVVVIICTIPLLMSTGQKGQVVVRRLEAIESARKRGHKSLDLELLRDELLSGVPMLNRLLMRWAGAFRLRTFLAQAGLDIKPGKLVLTIGVAALGAFVIVEMIYHSVLAGAIAGIAVGFIPTSVVSFLRMRRLRQFEKHFPEAIDLLSRAVRAGHAFSTGMEMIGKELPEPVSGEFRTTFEEQNLGLPLREALFNLAARVPLVDVRFFVTALLIQKETGGNLAEILDNLSTTIRERFKILGEVRVRTAQGRLTAAILIALPPIMLLLLKSVNPEYVNLLWNDPWGIYILLGAFCLQLVGSMILWKVVHIEV